MEADMDTGMKYCYTTHMARVFSCVCVHNLHTMRMHMDMKLSMSPCPCPYPCARARACVVSVSVCAVANVPASLQELSYERAARMSAPRRAAPCVEKIHVRVLRMLAPVVRNGWTVGVLCVVP